MSDLLRAAADVLAVAAGRGCDGALVGGFAVSVRCEPRFTRDVGLAVAVPDDLAAEDLVHTLVTGGYGLVTTVEQVATGRFATARFRTGAGSRVALLFASCGIEPEIVAAADELEVVAGIRAPVATVGHLIAMKLLSASDDRPTDGADLRALVGAAGPADLAAAAEAVVLVHERGYSRRRDLAAELWALAA